MPIGLLKEILLQRPENTRLLGLDVGNKTIGLALSDSAQRIATPLHTVRRSKFAKDMEALGGVVEDYGIEGFIIGYPVNMDSSEGPACDRVRSFADEMRQYPQFLGADPWIAFWDERLSTVSVENLVDNYVDINKAKRKGIIDKLAAQVILQGALDFIQAVRD